MRAPVPRAARSLTPPRRRPPAKKQDYASVAKKLREISRLEEISGLLGWDELVMQPPGAADARAAQKEALAGVLHDKSTSADLGALLERLSEASASGNDLGAPDAETAAVRRAVVRDALDAYRREARIPKELAMRMASLESNGYHAWVKARKEKDFSQFAPVLREWVEVLRKKAELIDPAGEPYSVLLQSFDKGNSRERLDEIFGELKEGLVPLLRELRAAREARLVGSGAEPDEKKQKTGVFGNGSINDPSWIYAEEGKGFDVKAQAELCRQLCLDLGFDFERGRIDVSVHPFTGGAGPSDVRLTTRFKNEDVTEGLTGAIHETGHGLYEMQRNTDAEWEGLPVNSALGMSCHESQSLLWERCVALSPQYSQYLLPKLAAAFPDSAFAVAAKEADGPQRLHAALNALKVPSHIRVESDEVHYPLHVLLRFELEKDLIDGKLKVEDLPAAWNAKALEYLGEAPPDDAQGVLQDTHWSGGAMAYFPTYSLGAAMAVQIFEAAKKDLPDLDAQIARGEFAPLKAWLRDKVHRKGSFYPSADALLESATGKPLDVKIFLKYLRDKYRKLYGLE